MADETWPEGRSAAAVAGTAFTVVVWLLWTLLLLPVQIVAAALDLGLALRIPILYHRGLCRLFGLEVQIQGAPSTVRPTLFVANHCSYFDVPVLASLQRASFVAKQEIREWPLLGLLARLQRSVFISRRRAGIRAARDEIARRLDNGANLILFPEGTTSDGNRVLSFYSALFSLDRDLLRGRLTVQPVTIAYTRQNGMPIGHLGRARYAWFGDMALARHFWRALQGGRVTVVVHFHPPVEAADFASRKALSEHCFGAIAAGLEDALRGTQAVASA